MDWNSSALWGIIGLVGGLVISSFFYIIGIKRKSLIYEIITTVLVSEHVTQIENINIEYNNKPVNNLCVSTIKLKNTGNSIIENSDFDPSMPLALITDGEFFINFESNTNSPEKKELNKLSPLLETNKNNICQKAIIPLTYISKSKTVICTVFHTGDLFIEGKLKEGTIKNVQKRYILHDPSWTFILGMITGGGAALLGFCASYIF